MCTCFFLFNRARDLFITARLHNHYFAKSVKKKHIMKKNSMFWKEFDQYSSVTQWCKINKKKSPFAKMLQLRYQRKVTWARFARTGWVTKNGNSNPVYVTMSGISPVSMITTRSHNHHLVHIADQFADAVSTIIQSWGLALYFLQGTICSLRIFYLVLEGWRW